MAKKTGKNLVIVESPTKARTIRKFLGSEYEVESSFGHIRDLPRSKMGIDIEHNFTPHYVIPVKNRKRVTELKKIAQSAKHVYFATDEDREGEAISWHLQELLDVDPEKSERIVFHEVTATAIKNALEHPRKLYQHLVDAQQARRILDRLVGYELSPFLWRKVVKGLSAGRVQSVAVRLIVEREREILDFKPEEYWSIEIEVRKREGDTTVFTAKLHSIDETTLEKKPLVDEASATRVLSDIDEADFFVKTVTVKEMKKIPPAPYTTSTLQQDANRRLRLSTKQTMMLAQQLYEGIETNAGAEGLITYMRTDSLTLAESFLQESKQYLSKNFGESYAHTRRYTTKSKLAQEAHEAIRPTSAYRTPESLKPYLDEQQYKLYELIWQRAIASQMSDARLSTTSIDIIPRAKSAVAYVFRANGQTMVFEGFLKVYPVQTEEAQLPHVEEGEQLVKERITPVQHFTKPPARYSEAGLVKVLEEHGIGRPSTYAPTISTIIERNYVQREDRRLKPTELAFLVNDLLVEHFPNIVDYSFTARMEDDLDSIAEGTKEWVPVIRDFYAPFKENLEKKEQELSKQDISVTPTDQVCEKCGKPMVIRIGRFGKFIACSGFPECKNTKPVDEEKRDGDEGGGNEKIEIPPCEKCGAPMVIKAGRFGKFYGCSAYPECKNIRNMRDKKLDIKCPTCAQGDVIMKRSKRGKTFFGCSRYPECDFVSWTRPGSAEDSKKE